MALARSTRLFGAILVACLAAAPGCGSERRTQVFRRGGGDCTPGSYLDCECTDGTNGQRVCNGTEYGACQCGADVDAGPGVDAGAAVDSGVPGPDTGVPPVDAGFFDAGTREDAGFPDLGFPDSGVRPDAGFPDSGVRPDAGFPDSGVRPDAGFPDSGVPPGPCVSDADCGAPISVCENGQCIPGCYPGGAGALTCANPDDCNPISGRCDGFIFCLDDTMCNPPLTVCEVVLCLPGCGQPGGLGCAQGQVCNQATGRCL